LGSCTGLMLRAGPAAAPTGDGGHDIDALSAPLVVPVDGTDPRSPAGASPARPRAWPSPRRNPAQQQGTEHGAVQNRPDSPVREWSPTLVGIGLFTHYCPGQGRPSPRWPLPRSGCCCGYYDVSTRRTLRQRVSRRAQSRVRDRRRSSARRAGAPEAPRCGSTLSQRRREPGMRRRLVQLAVAAAMLAVGLFGLPLAVAIWQYADSSSRTAHTMAVDRGRAGAHPNHQCPAGRSQEEPCAPARRPRWRHSDSRDLHGRTVRRHDRLLSRPHSLDRERSR
jgi:hypothetical protein